MADYYNQGYNSGPSSRQSLLGTLGNLVMYLLTLLTAVVMLLTFAAPYVNPAKVWIFSILGLIAPAIYIVTILLALYWVIRWRWRPASAMLLLVVVGLFKVSLFYKPELRRVYGEPTYSSSDLKIMSYNVRNFYGSDQQNSANAVLDFIAAENPDILCLQEFNVHLAEQVHGLEALMEGYHSAVGIHNVEAGTLAESPLVIYSRYPILRTGISLTGDLGLRESVWADVLVGEDTMRVFNNHLHSTAIRASDDDFITNRRFITDTARKDKIRSIVDRFRDNSILRAVEVDSIAQVVAATPYEKIVCGDFNDTPMSYVYRAMAEGLNDAFRECGRGYSHTYRGFYNMLRIDYILSSDRFTTLSYQVSGVEYSDHHPVIVWLKYNKKNI